MHYTALSGSGEGLGFGRDQREGVCLWLGLSACQRRMLEGHWEWKLDLAHGFGAAACVSFPCHLLSSPHQLPSAGRKGSVKSNKLQAADGHVLVSGGSGHRSHSAYAPSVIKMDPSICVLATQCQLWNKV